MSLNFNGKEPKNVLYNGNEVKKIIYNGNIIWEKNHNLFNNKLTYIDLNTMVETEENLFKGLLLNQNIFFGLYYNTIGTKCIFNRTNIVSIIIPIENNSIYRVSPYNKGIMLCDENLIGTYKTTANEFINNNNSKYAVIYVSNKAHISTGVQNYTEEDVLNNEIILKI